MTAPINQYAIQGMGQQSADNLNTYVQWTTNCSTLRAFIGLPNMTVFMLGTLTPGDGGQGSFWYDYTSTAPDDNGVTTVKPIGAGFYGAWTRLPITNGSGGGSQQLVASMTIIGGSLVNVFDNGGAFNVRLADSTVYGKPANGFVLSGVNALSVASVFFSGIDNVLTGLAPGQLWLGPAGTVSGAPPSAPGSTIQTVGVAFSPTAMNFLPGTTVQI